MSSARSVRSILIAATALVLAWSAAPEARAQVLSREGSTGTKPFYIYRQKVGDITGKTEVEVDEAETEQEAMDKAQEKREAEQRLDITYDWRRRGTASDPPVLQDPSVPNADPPKGKTKSTPVVKLTRVDPGPYRTLEKYNGYNNPFDKKAEVVGSWKGESVLGTSKRLSAVVVFKDDTVSIQFEGGAAGGGTWTREGDTIKISWSNGVTQSFQLKGGVITGGGTGSDGQPWSVSLRKQ